MAAYSYFIKENVAPKSANRIDVFKLGEKVGHIPIGALMPPNSTRPHYSFALISDPHVGESEDINETFKNTIGWLCKKDAIEFVLVAGDLITAKNSPSTEQREAFFKTYGNIIAENSNGKRVLAIGGNHEQWRYDRVPEFMKEYAGVDECVYHFWHGKDLFVMAGSYGFYQTEDGTRKNQTFSADDLKKIRRLMNENKNSRCFFIHHVQPLASSPEYDLDTVTVHGYLPNSFFAHFKNMTMFHGHSHLAFEYQKTNKDATYNETLGFRSVHIPGLCDAKQGYIVDVYDEGYHLRGYNFAEKKPVPIGTYWIDTSHIDVNTDY